MIDHPSQLSSLPPFPHPPLVFLKIDTSYGRAGVPPRSPACAALVDAALEAERGGKCVLHGVYSHAGHSYAARDGGDDVWGYLKGEVGGLVEVARVIKEKRKSGGDGDGAAGLVLSVGATPTATVVQQRGFMDGGDAERKGGKMAEVERLVGELRAEGFLLEVHAGV